MARWLLIKVYTAFLVMLAFPAVAQVGYQIEHQLVRRVVVFPIKADAKFAKSAEEAWWQAREELTRSRRFLVASKQFLTKTDVFQSRGDLQPADAIILGKLLDAHALITLQLKDQQKDRQFIMNVYDGGTGFTLWQKAVPLHPSLTVEDQLTNLATKLVSAFVASIPYQGFTLIDSLIGQPVYEEGDVKLAKVDLGVTTGAQIGDLVQWMKLRSENTAPFFQGGGKQTIVAEGKIVVLEQGVATVEILRASNIKEIREYSLVRIPREADRLQAEYGISDAPRTTLTPEIVAPEANPMEQIARERKPLVASLSWVSSLVVFLLLAF